MGLVKAKRDVILERAAALEAKKAALVAALAAPSGDGMEVSDVGGGAIEAELAATNSALESLSRSLAAEDERIAAWKMENIRRKHNYIPFVVNLFRMLAEKGHLKPMIDKAYQSRRE